MKVESGLAALLNQLNSASKGATSGTTNTVNTTADASYGSSSVSADVGNLAKAMANADARLASQPVVDSQRVAELAAAVADGSYQVDSDQVAARVIEFESALEKAL